MPSTHRSSTAAAPNSIRDLKCEMLRDDRSEPGVVLNAKELKALKRLAERQGVRFKPVEPPKFVAGSNPMLPPSKLR